MTGFDNLTLRERVQAYVRREILAARMAPGSVLLEAPLADKLGVSRGPVREALARLAAEGLVTISPRRAIVVTTHSKNDYLEAYQIREALEMLGTRLAIPRMTDGDFDQLETDIDEMARCAGRNDQAGYFAANRAFHDAFIAMSGNRRLTDMYRGLIELLGPQRRPNVWFRSDHAQLNREHRAMLEAARTRDIERAAETVKAHVQVAIEQLMAQSDEQFAQFVHDLSDKPQSG